jgi:long-chain acyl-CoA synthetase
MAEVLFVSEEFFPIVEQIRPALRTVQRVIALSGSHHEWESYMAWCDAQDGADPRMAIAGDDVVLQLCTSGTTGHPKGAQITHDNILAALQAADEFYPCATHDVSLACMPQFHIGGSFLGLIALYAGERDVITREATPSEIVHLIQSERVTLAFFVPALMLFLLQTDACQEVDFSSLKRIVYGASPIPLDLLREALATFRCEFAHLYGLTETTGVVTVLPPEDHDLPGSPRMRSCGKPLSNAEIKVVAADNADLPLGQVGKSWCAPARS